VSREIEEKKKKIDFDMQGNKAGYTA